MKIKTCGTISGTAASLALLAFGFSGASAFAAATASDTAGNYVSSGWNSTPANNGTGFGAWSINVENNDGPPYAGTYLAGSGNTPIVDASGNAWGTYANSAQGTTLPSVIFTRPFTAGASGSSSLFDQTFSFDMGSGGVGPGQGLLSAGIGSAFLLEYNGLASGDNMFLGVDGATPQSIAVDFSQLSAGLNVSLAVNGAVNSPAENYIFTITPFAGGAAIFTQSGTFDSSTYNTSQFQFTDSNTTGNGYFNTLNLSVETVPEPSSIALFGMSGLGMLFAFRRRK
jgi:hypothetical protein